MLNRDFLLDLFAPFGPVTLRRMFSGHGISIDSVTFALAIQDAVYLRADDASIPAFEAENSAPFSYQARGRTVTVRSYWRMPERLYDDPDAVATWARAALDAAMRVAAAKRAKPRSRAKESARAKSKTAQRSAKTGKSKRRETSQAT